MGYVCCFHSVVCVASIPANRRVLSIPLELFKFIFWRRNFDLAVVRASRTWSESTRGPVRTIGPDWIEPVVVWGYMRSLCKMNNCPIVTVPRKLFHENGLWSMERWGNQPSLSGRRELAPLWLLRTHSPKPKWPSWSFGSSISVSMFLCRAFVRNLCEDQIFFWTKEIKRHQLHKKRSVNLFNITID